MTRVLVVALGIGGLTLLVLLQLETPALLVTWEVLLLLLLIVMIHDVPSPEPTHIHPLVGVDKDEEIRPPRSVSRFELSAVHAFSESRGADRRLKGAMQRLAVHRLRHRGVLEGSPEAHRLVERALWADDSRPLSAAQMRRIVDQLERL
jgi:hypothetical protein